MVRIENVRRDYVMGDVAVQALKGISLTVNKGDFLAIAGPSGSGKTTLLNIIGCIDRADGGTIRIDGEDVGKKTKDELALFRRRQLGFIFQTFNLIPVLTAYENVAFALSILNIPAEEERRRTMAILDEVGLSGMENRRPNRLSGGQQQRVAIARALVKEPLIVLADEPTANLDSRTGETILKLMLEMNRKHNTTFIFSTHDPMVMDYARRLVRLHDGEIVSDETRPSGAETAGAPGAGARRNR
jgi:putative ABC transport system ATP-binding protein